MVHFSLLLHGGGSRTSRVCREPLESVENLQSLTPPHHTALQSQFLGIALGIRLPLTGCGPKTPEARGDEIF